MQRPEDATCRDCGIYSRHNLINGYYICPNCGYTTKIKTWDECKADLERMKQFWLDIKDIEFFSQEKLDSIDLLIEQVNIKNKPLLN